MHQDIFIVDATAHGYNWSQENVAVDEAQSILAASWAFHPLLTGPNPDYLLTEDEFLRDWPMQDVADTLFYEAGVDVICHHGTPIWSFFKDGHAANKKGLELKRAYPQRAVAYAGIDPWELETPEAVRAEVDRLADEGYTGLKLYAARYKDRRTYANPLDDEKLAYPMIEQAIERGIKAIGSHKAIPVGPVDYRPYGVGDFPAACAMYPEMNFEIVHSGMAFIEETAAVAANHLNCWLNLEVSFAMVTFAPRRFAEFLGALLAVGGEDRLLYASGISLVHPHLAIRDFLAFEMPEDLVQEYGMPPLTDEGKRKILGSNFLRMHGIDEDALRGRIADDDVSQRQAGGLEAPWSSIRADTKAVA